MRLRQRDANQCWVVTTQIESLKVRETVEDGRKQVYQLVAVKIELLKVREAVEDVRRQVAQLVGAQSEPSAAAHVVENVIPQSCESLDIEVQDTALGWTGPRAVQDAAGFFRKRAAAEGAGQTPKSPVKSPETLCRPV